MIQNASHHVHVKSKAHVVYNIIMLYSIWEDENPHQITSASVLISSGKPPDEVLGSQGF